MKRILVLTVFAALIGSLYGQSVTELARKEKARRDGLGARRAKVVTNADLAAVRKTPAIVVGNPDSSAEEANPSGVVGGDSGAAPAPVDNSGGVVMTPRVIQNGPGLFQDNSGSTLGPGAGADPAARLKAAEDLVDLLTTKINALMQQATNLDNMTPKDSIQQQIDETNQKLLRVQQEAARLKAQVEAGKQGSPEKR